MEMNKTEQMYDPSQNVPTFTKSIDGRTYLVTLHFASTGETFEQKYERLLRQSIMDQLNSQK